MARTVTRSIKASFWKRLRAWYLENRRAFPWRESSNPFYLLLAEMMLRRTRARQVAPVYRTAIAKYPTPVDLAVAKRSSIKKGLQSLGLAWRISQFQIMARELVNRFGAVRVIADSLIHGSEPRDFAMLDLAALVCTPRAPRDELCPLRRTCRKARDLTFLHRHA